MWDPLISLVVNGYLISQAISLRDGVLEKWEDSSSKNLEETPWLTFSNYFTIVQNRGRIRHGEKEKLEYIGDELRRTGRNSQG
jgi:hypothetical protein